MVIYLPNCVLILILEPHEAFLNSLQLFHRAQREGLHDMKKLLTSFMSIDTHHGPALGRIIDLFGKGFVQEANESKNARVVLRRCLILRHKGVLSHIVLQLARFVVRNYVEISCLLLLLEKLDRYFTWACILKFSLLRWGSHRQGFISISQFLSHISSYFSIRIAFDGTLTVLLSYTFNRWTNSFRTIVFYNFNGSLVILLDIIKLRRDQFRIPRDLHDRFRSTVCLILKCLIIVL